MLGLGIEYQDEIEVTATCGDAAKAVDAVVSMLSNLVEHTEIIEKTHVNQSFQVKDDIYYGVAASKGEVISCLAKLEDAQFEFNELANNADEPYHII